MFSPYSLDKIPGFSATRCQRQAEQLLRSRNASQVGVNWTRRRSSSWSEAVTCNCGASSRRTRLGCQCASLGWNMVKRLGIRQHWPESSHSLGLAYLRCWFWGCFRWLHRIFWGNDKILNVSDGDLEMIPVKEPPIEVRMEVKLLTTGEPSSWVL